MCVTFPHAAWRHLLCALQVTCWVNFAKRQVWYFDPLGQCNTDLLRVLDRWVRRLWEAPPQPKKTVRRTEDAVPLWAPVGDKSKGRWHPSTYAVCF